MHIYIVFLRLNKFVLDFFILFYFGRRGCLGGLEGVAEGGQKCRYKVKRCLDRYLDVGY